MQTFAKTLSNIQILLLLDNTTAEAYINHIGDSIPTGIEVSEGSTDLVLEMGNHSKSSTSPRKGECDSRSGIQCEERQIQLDVESCNIQQDSGSSSSGDRLICLLPINTTAKIFQLATRSPGSGKQMLYYKTGQG